VVPGLQEVDAIGANHVDEPVLLRDVPRPRVWKRPQALGLSDSRHGIAPDRFDEIEDA
jgi:hypothetical protein